MRVEKKNRKEEPVTFTLTEDVCIGTDDDGYSLILEKGETVQVLEAGKKKEKDKEPMDTDDTTTDDEDDELDKDDMEEKGYKKKKKKEATIRRVKRLIEELEGE